MLSYDQEYVVLARAFHRTSGNRLPFGARNIEER